MITKRKFRRYVAPIPVRIRLADGDEHLLIPANISLGGCFFDFELPFSIERHIDQVSLVLPGEESETVVVEASLKQQDGGFFSPGETRGYMLSWKTPSGEVAKVSRALLDLRVDPSTEKKVDYVIAEQKNLLRSIRDIEKGKYTGYKFLFTAIVAFLIYMAAPYQLPGFGKPGMVMVFAVGGIWISVILIFYCDRLLRFLGKSFRRKAFYFKSLSLNRSYVFSGDAEYYKNTVFPLGIYYDDARTESYSADPEKRKIEYFPQAIRYAAFTTFYFMFIEALFVFGFFYFLSIVLRVVDGSTAIDAQNLFDLDYFTDGLVKYSVFLFFWIQAMGNECAHFQESVWEAKRIAVERPNVKVSGEEFWSRPYFKIPARILLYSVFGYGILCLVSGWLSIADSSFFQVHFFNVITVFTVALVFLVGKIIYIYILLSEEGKRWGDRTSNMR